MSTYPTQPIKITQRKYSTFFEGLHHAANQHLTFIVEMNKQVFQTNSDPKCNSDVLCQAINLFNFMKMFRVEK